MTATETVDIATESGTTDGPEVEGVGPWRVSMVIGALFVLGAVVPIAVANYYGALEIPRSDDWSYLLTLFQWADSGTLDFNGWVTMTLVGQVMLATPVVWLAGDSISAVHVLSAVVSFGGLVATYWLGRLVLRPTAAAVVALVMAVVPFWAALAPTYMSDNWAFSAQMLALALAATAFRRSPVSMRWLSASVAVGFVAVSIRQYAAVVVIAVLLVAWLEIAREGDRRRLVVLGALTAGFAVLTAGLLIWWSGIPGSKTFSAQVPNLERLRDALRFSVGYFRLIGLVLVPVVLLAGPVRIARRAWSVSRTWTIVFVLVFGGYPMLAFARVSDIAFVNNYVARAGVLSQEVLTGTRPEVMPGIVFNLMVWLGTISGVLIVLHAVPWLAALPARYRSREWSPRSPMTAVFALATFGFLAAYALAALIDLPVFDRYALGIFPLVAMLLLTAAPSGARARAQDPRGARAPRRSVVLAAMGIGAFFVIGLGYAVESASFDATRWRVATLVTEQGYSPLQIDAGFEWVAWHREQGPPFRLRVDRDISRGIRIAFQRPFCVQVSIGSTPRVGYVIRQGPVIAEGETVGLFRAPERMVARRFRDDCVPGEPEPVGRAALP